MKAKVLIFGLVVALSLVSTGLMAAQAAGPLDRIIVYRGETAGTGTGLNSFKLAVGEEMTVTAKGVDENGNDVAIWPTWKGEKELSITVVEGRSKTAVVKALKAGAPLFFSAVYKTDDGKKVVGEVMGTVK